MSVAGLVIEGVGPGSSRLFLFTGGLATATPAPVVVSKGGKIARQKRKPAFIELENGMRVFGTREELERILDARRAAAVVPPASPAPSRRARRLAASVLPNFIEPQGDDEEELILMMLLDA